MSAPPKSYPIITVHTINPDPTNAINAFLWCMSRARDIGMSPPTEHALAEQLFRKDARIMFYSSMNGVASLVMDDEAAGELADDDTFDFMISMLRRRAERAKARRAEQAELAAQVDTHPQGGDSSEAPAPLSSAVAEGHAPE